MLGVCGCVNHRFLARLIAVGLSQSGAEFGGGLGALCGWPDLPWVAPCRTHPRVLKGAWPQDVPTRGVLWGLHFLAHVRTFATPLHLKS